MDRDGTFSYTCNFCGLCCHAKVIVLSRYDVLRIAGAAGIPTGEAVRRFTIHRSSILKFGDNSCVALSVRRNALEFEVVLGQDSIARLDEELARSDVGAMSLLLPLLGALRPAVRTHRNLALENLALKQQLALLRRRSKRPRFGSLDRAFWVWLSRRWAGWREALHIVRPETVIRWHRKGFRSFWTWKSRRGRTGRPRIGSELAELVRTMALANPLWGAPRIHGELLKLGLDVSQRTVARLMPRRPKPPSQTWRTFLQNHVLDLVSVDFFVVPTATFRLLYVFVVLLQHRRKVVHFNVTDSPTAAWTAQQIVEAFPDDSAPHYLLRDRDGI